MKPTGAFLQLRAELLNSAELESSGELRNNTDTWALPKANYWKFLADGAQAPVLFSKLPR